MRGRKVPQPCLAPQFHESQAARPPQNRRRGHGMASMNGEYYVSFGDEGRSWEEAVKYGFISAGGGTWFTNTLKLLKPGDRIWVKIPAPATSASAGSPDFPRPKRSSASTWMASRCRLRMFWPQANRRMTREDGALCPDRVGRDRFRRQRHRRTGPVRQPQHCCAPKVPAWQTTIDRLQGAFPKYDSV